MLARVARYEVAPERCEEAVEAFTGAGDEIAGMTGFQSGYVLVDSESGSIISCTFWNDGQSLETSAARAASARRRAVDAVEGEVVSVQTFDVVRELSG
jgi:heme-degrading monooxygenase HmoA